MDKTKFLRDPQLDSEGFLDTAAPCRGCRPEDMCPRSGHCANYDLRHHIYGISSAMGDTPFNYGQMNRAMDARINDMLEEQGVPAPEAFITQDGTKIERVSASPWSLLDQDHLDRIHAIWLASEGRVRDELRAYHTQAIMGIRD